MSSRIFFCGAGIGVNVFCRYFPALQPITRVIFEMFHQCLEFGNVIDGECSSRNGQRFGFPEFFVVRAEYDRYAVDRRFGYVVYAYAEASSDVGNLSILVYRR